MAIQVITNYKNTYNIQFNELAIIREIQSKSEWVWAP